MEGGPFQAMCRALHLVRNEPEDTWRLSFVGWVVTWPPLVVLSLLGGASGVLRDLTVEVRPWLALPLLFLAARLLGNEVHWCTERFFADGVAGADAPQVPALFAKTARACNAALPELLLLAAALASGVSLVVRTGALPPAHLWYALVTAPLTLFLLLRVLWRWLLWCQLLWRLARLELHLDAGHPDGHAGLKPLSRPSLALAPALMAASVLGAAGWAQLFLEKHTPPTLGSFAALFAVAGLVVAFGPLLIFIGPLARARSAGLRDYGALAYKYTAAFRSRWIVTRPSPEALLGTADLQSMADLGNVFAIVDRTRIVPFDLRRVIGVAVATLLPMVPLVFFRIPLKELVIRVLKMVAG
jgi:hypothetical protein